MQILDSQSSVPWDSKMTHSVCSAPQNVILLMNAMEWDFTDRCGGQ